VAAAWIWECPSANGQNPSQHALPPRNIQARSSRFRISKRVRPASEYPSIFVQIQNIQAYLSRFGISRRVSPGLEYPGAFVRQVQNIQSRSSRFRISKHVWNIQVKNRKPNREGWSEISLDILTLSDIPRQAWKFQGTQKQPTKLHFKAFSNVLNSTKCSNKSTV